MGNDFSYADDSPSINRLLTWNGDYYFSLPSGWSLTATPNFTYNHNNSHRRYSTTIPGNGTITNDAMEDAFSLGLSANVRKRFNPAHSMTIKIRGGADINDIDYTGSSPYSSHLSNSFFSGSAGYNFLSQKFSAVANAGIVGEFFRTHGQKYDDIYPFANISMTYSPNSKNYLSLGAQYATTTPDLAQRSPNVVQINELMFRTGGSDLKNTRFTTVSLSYAFMPSNKFSLSAFALYSGSYRRIISAYELYDNGNALLNTYINNGNFLSTQVGVSATLRLLNNSLVLQAAPVLKHFKSTGYLSSSRNPLTVSVFGQYYIRNFNFTAFYSTRTRVMEEQTAAYSTTPSYYYIQAGWSNGNWNLSLTANNIFRSNHIANWYDMVSPLLSVSTTQFNGNYRRCLAISATYTFGYGKKIQMGDEVGRQSDASSAIIQ